MVAKSTPINLPHLLGTIVFLLIQSCSLIDCQNNLYTRQPILREVDGLDDGAMFGYSLVLHQTLANPTNMTEALRGARIIVSAPNGTVSGGVLPNTGIVFSCPVNPGTCSPLPGKLNDTTPNADRENKTGQFLGGSMDSKGGNFLVCAHRYARDLELSGKCFFTDGNRALENFQEYQPCTDFGGSSCVVGTGSVTVPDGDSHVLGLGAPGRTVTKIIDGRGEFFRLGSIFRRSEDGGTRIRDDEGITSEVDANYGYTIVSGRFMTKIRQDFAVSVPRNKMYLGTVHIIANNNNLNPVSESLEGTQMGEFFGFSLLAVDLNGDGFDELLVGAPLYRTNLMNPDVGRVFLYENNGGNLVLLKTIEGEKRFSRFGHAMANLGDINGDGYDDVAISAPFTEAGTSNPGTVYIYHSSPRRLLTDNAQQIIRGTDLSLTQDLSGLRGFGASLASGVDVDLNGYNDLLIGSFMSQQVFLLRTRPVAVTQVSLTANPTTIDVLDKSRPECTFNGVQHACFNLTACVSYSGQGITNTLRIRFDFSADLRLFFENENFQFSREVTASINNRICIPVNTYVQNTISDIFSSFTVDMSIDTPLRQISPGNGNEAPMDLSGIPSLTVTKAPQVQVETLKQCGGGECIPDLKITRTRATRINPRTYQPSTITAGSTTSVDVFLDVENAGLDAFQSSLSFVLPTSLELVNAFNQTSSGDVSLSCRFEQIAMDGQSLTRHNCSIGNPFTGPGRIQLRVNLSPIQRMIIGNESAVAINFTVDSLNPENSNTVVDNSNFAVTQLMFEARANITINDGTVTPERVSYADNSRLNESQEALADITQLGPSVGVSFRIQNNGPSSVPNIQLDIQWPLNSSVIGENYYLYITSIRSTGAGQVTCSNQHTNPLNLTDNLQSISQGDGDSTSLGRKKRFAVKRTLRNKRQEANPEQGQSEDVTLSCMPSESDVVLNCVNIRCNIRGLLPGSNNALVEINSRLDERFFSTDNDRYTITPVASIRIVDGDYIKSNDGSDDRSAIARVLVIPAGGTRRDAEPSAPDPVPWWAIVVPILAVLILVIVVVILLWVFGFFRRRKYEEIKQKREELKNLTAEGDTPADASDTADPTEG